MERGITLFGRVVDLTTLIGGCAILLMAGHITADVLMKAVVGKPLPGTIVFVSNWYMVFAAFLPMAFAERRNSHISVEVMTENFPPRLQRFTNVLTMILAAIVFAALAWQSFIEAERARASGAFVLEMGLKIPVWPARYSLPFGAGLMVLVLLVKIGRAMRRPIPLDQPFF